MSIGAQLRTSREAKGLSIDALAHTTRVQPRILAAIERDDVGAVPPRPFGRGFVRAYARELGLDGDQTARDYFAQFAPVVATAATTATAPTTAPADRDIEPRRRSSIQGTRAWPFVVISLGAVTGITLALVTGRPAATTASRRAATAVVGTSGASAAPAAGDATPVGARSTDAASAAAPARAASTPAANLTIVLTATRPSWVTADADGRRAAYLTVRPGSPLTLTARREIVIRVGDAGALVWQINGREAGAMGRPGQIRDIEITPATATTIR
jgi:hypothetical protein